MAVPATDESAEMAKPSGNVKNSGPVPKSSSPRDSQSDLDTVLVVSSDEIIRARAAVESITSETATVDCHPVILDDQEEDTDRFVEDASSSGLVEKRPLLARAQKEQAAKTPAIEELDPGEEIEVSISSIISDGDMTPTREAIIDPVAAKAAKVDEPIARPAQTAKSAPPAKSAPRPVAPRPGPSAPPPGKQEPRATITEIQELDTHQVGLGSLDSKDIETKDVELDVDNVKEEETATQERKPVPRFDDETMPMPKPVLGDIAGALETVPLNAALVQGVLAQVDARAAARKAGQPVPPLNVGPNISPMNPHMPAPAHVTPRHPPGAVQTHPRMGHVPTQMPIAAPRRIGVEIFITLLAFLAVAVPALYYLYVTFAQ